MESNYFSDHQWKLDRMGRFTASEIHKLFVSGRSKIQLFGTGAETYIRTKAAEILTMEVKDEQDFKQAEHGKLYEFDAYQAFENETGLTGTYYGVANPKFFPLSENAGFSPDWESADGLIGADFKCPYNTAEHVKNLLLKSQEDFKNERWEYYCQGQMGMYVRGWKEFRFVSYDPRMVQPELRLKILTVTPDDEWREEFKMRLDKATDRLLEIVEQLKPHVFNSAA